MGALLPLPAWPLLPLPPAAYSAAALAAPFAEPDDGPSRSLPLTAVYGSKPGLALLLFMLTACWACCWCWCRTWPQSSSAPPELIHTRCVEPGNGNYKTANLPITFPHHHCSKQPFGRALVAVHYRPSTAPDLQEANSSTSAISFRQTSIGSYPFACSVVCASPWPGSVGSASPGAAFTPVRPQAAPDPAAAPGLSRLRWAGEGTQHSRALLLFPCTHATGDVRGHSWPAAATRQ